MVMQAKRYHDISVGHRVNNHESKCAHLHGHNYRVHFTIERDTSGGRVDSLGRVIDFSVIKDNLCMWLEANWDHRFLVHEKDPRADALKQLDPDGVRRVSFNPTAENMAYYLLRYVGPVQLDGLGVRLVSVTIEETRKCSVTYKD